ncbi:MAG: S41 family peptidase [Candidatus Saccharimonas sp.]
MPDEDNFRREDELKVIDPRPERPRRFRRNRNRRRGDGRPRTSALTLFIAGVLIAAVAFIAGTRSDQILAVVGPVFGVKVSTDTLDTSILQQTYHDMQTKFDGKLDDSALADGAVRGMVAAAGDQFTVFMSAKEASDFQKELNGEVSGIGCVIGMRGGQPTILRILPGSPADKAGLLAGDVFVSINGQTAVGVNQSIVASQVRGDSGTTVKVEVKRGSDTKIFSITRAQVSDPSVRWSINGTVGTMIISRFDEDTGDLAKKAATEFASKGVKSVIVDLRDNGGGYLDAARAVASIWLDNKLVVSEKTNGVTVDSIYSDKDPILKNVKTVILVNGGTASASEILAGALKDYKLATIVGLKTYGKGSVQEVLNLPDGRLLKVTIAKWYTPNGVNITASGITPDKVVDLTAADADAGLDPQLDAATKLAE